MKPNLNELNEIQQENNKLETIKDLMEWYNENEENGAI